MSTASEWACMVTDGTGWKVIPAVFGASEVSKATSQLTAYSPGGRGELIVDPASVHEDEQVAVDGAGPRPTGQRSSGDR